MADTESSANAAGGTSLPLYALLPPAVKQILLLVGLAAAVAAGVALVLWSQGENYTPLYSGLADRDIGEITAQLDGASGWRHLRFITLPLLRPAIVAAIILRGLDAFRVFASPLVLSGVEGTPVLSTYAYHQWADYGNDILAAAAAVLLAIISVTLTVPFLRWKAGA